ncbi:MAG: ribonuclease PH [Anaerolineae bacterium]|nr:ribonuclease PH [Anaerolineae bacterium]NIN99165.1 ribonuclease PH [Anaerolineae bacterium]NIQ82006.1 ribonuclease PH [Anaerolineae bacterium]
MRFDGRANDEMRPVVITPGYLDHPEGSALIEMGRTRIICTASIEERVPLWLRDQAQGWVTAEYGMLPRSTHQRMPRETRGPRDRTQEIRRLIGRSLRAGVDLHLLGERTVTVDCDVIQADGGTRTASITAGYVALAIGLRKLIKGGLLSPRVLGAPISAISVGVVQEQVLLDLNYDEDSQAQVDFNVVMSGPDKYVEIQGTAEQGVFSREAIDELLTLAQKGIADLIQLQREAFKR